MLFLFYVNSGYAQQDIYDINRVLEIKIEFAESNWDVLLDSLKEEGNDDRLVGNLIFNGVRYDSVGVRYKGNSSYFNVRNTGSSKLPFNIKLDYKKKNQQFKSGHETLKLSNIFRDPSFLREVLSYEIAGQYMPAPKANFAKVYVNGEYLGLYNNTESVDKLFLKNNFGYSKGVLFKCDPTWHAKFPKHCDKGEKAALMYQGEDSTCYYSNYELKSKKGWSDLIQLTYILNKEPDKLPDVLNIDQVLWMHAFNNVVVNLDSYAGRLCHNYYLYKDTFGIFHPVTWDMNLSFGGFRYDGTGIPLSNQKLQELSPFLHYKSPNRPLISQILQISLYRKIYIAHIRTILNDFFINGKYLERIIVIQQIINTQVEADTNKLYTYEDFLMNDETTAKAGKSNIIGIEELMNARTDYLKAHPLLQKSPSKISDVKHIIQDTLTYISANAKDAETVWLAYRYTPNSPFKMEKMKDDGASGDQIANDEIYGLGIDYKPGITYYIIAEKEKTASLSPERASFEFHKIP